MFVYVKLKQNYYYEDQILNCIGEGDGEDGCQAHPAQSGQSHQQAVWS
jgi:hypothetical protein